jgi:pimeloyl-ACP methyl ester carboxylesterase
VRSPFLAAVLLTCAGGTLWYAQGVEQASSTTDPMALAPCHVESLAEEVECGVLEVFEDRDAHRGRRIPIHVAVLPPLRRTSERDPLFILSGGPGQGAREMAGAVARFFKPVRRSRAIVLVDLRGTGASAPLGCFESRDELWLLSDGPDSLLRGECLSELRGNPRYYTHHNALADLDEVRLRLGYSQINLWGGSWGTRAALIYTLTHPQAVRRVVLDGAVSLEMNFPHTVGADAQRAFDLLIERCTADAACAQGFPAHRAVLEDLLHELERTPATADIRHPRTGQRATVTLTRDAVAEIVRVALYTPIDAARVFLLLQKAVEGDVAPLVAQFVHSASLTSDHMALGTTLAILCSEDLPGAAPAGVEQDAAATFVRNSYASAWVGRCRDWPVGPPIEVDRHATSAAPALILSGLHDPVTPPGAGEAMTRHFTNSRHVVVPGAAHNASFPGCVPDLIAAFLDDRDIDAGCVNEVPLPPLLAGMAGARP